VREALNQLEAEGLLVRSPHMGTKVAEIVIEDAEEIYTIQYLLQSIAVQICARKLTQEDICEAEKLNEQIVAMTSLSSFDPDAVRVLNYGFHRIICGARVYPWLTRIISALWIRLPNRTIWVNPSESRVATQYHKKIIQAIKEGNSIRAGNLMKRHLQRTKRVLYG